MASSINAAVDGATAKACHDYEGRKVLKVPAPRRAKTRLLVVLTVLGLTAWAVEWIAVNSSGFHYKKVPYDSKEAQAYFLPVPLGSFLNASSDGMIPNNITCPCLGQPFLSWCNFIDFYFITCNQDTNYQLNVTMISTTNSSSCNQPTPNIDFICRNALDAFSCKRALDTMYDFMDIKTYIYTPNLASPFQVFDLVYKNMQSNIHINNQTVFGNLDSDNGKDYNRSILILSLIQSMVAQVFDCNTSSTMQQFWDKGNQCGWDLHPATVAQFNGRKFAFGMTFNYQAYSTTCKPKQCYIFVKDNFSTRFMHALAQVGGVASLILLGMQLVVWPIVARICRFPHAPHVQAGSMIENLQNLNS